MSIEPLPIHLQRDPLNSFSCLDSRGFVVSPVIGWSLQSRPSRSVVNPIPLRALLRVLLVVVAVVVAAFLNKKAENLKSRCVAHAQLESGEGA